MLTLEDRHKIIYLNQYVTLKRSIERKLDEKARVKSIAEKVTPTLSDLPSGSPDPHNRENSMAILADIENDIDADIAQMVIMKKMVERSICSVCNPKYRELLESRYINGMTFEEMLVHLGKRSWSSLHRMHERALGAVKIK